MLRMRLFAKTSIVAAGLCCVFGGASGSTPQENAQNAKRPGVDGNLIVTVGMSMIIDSPVAVAKISIANGDLAEAVAVNPQEILINGKAPGETSLIVWQQGGTRLVYDLIVRISTQKLDSARQQIARDFPDEDISVTYDNDAAFVRGSVKDTFEAARIMAIAATLGKAVNLLRVNVPAQEPQILLKVKFADVDRSVSQTIGLNLMSLAVNQPSAGILSPGSSVAGTGTFNLSDALNVLLFTKNFNLSETIQALESKNQLQMLAEPNVMATNGKVASFISGGQFPVPSVQAGANSGAVSVTYEPYGIQLKFLPQITARGTIMLAVTPEVSSLDFANAVTIAGTTVPGLTDRKIDTVVELEPGQSFVIAGLLDNETTRTLSKIPGLGDIPLLGKLFQSRSITKSNTELLVIVTPELVRPVPADQKPPELKYTDSFLPTNSGLPMRQPGMDKTGPVPVHPPSPTMPIEQLILEQQKQQQLGGPAPTVVNSPPVMPPATGTGAAPASSPLPGAGSK
ncbi:MAG: pilus assembly protein N-terminal domain-containing protein [Bryobacteraceae bacterium]|jgi:pilus assembly protein CpaC